MLPCNVEASRPEKPQQDERSMCDGYPNGLMSICPTSLTDGQEFNRLPYSQEDFFKEYQYEAPDKLPLHQKLRRSCACSGSRLLKQLKRRIPILAWLPSYNFRKDVLADIIAGITLAVVQIPQAMAFTMLSTASPILGLYATFFSTAVYFFLGTSKYSSLGMAGVTALVVGKAINDQVDKLQPPNMPNGMDGNFTTMSPDVDIDLLKTQVATTMSFIVGILQISMGLLNLGSLAMFFSEVMMRACQMAAVLQMIISQTPHLLGIKIHSSGGVLSAVNNVIQICKKIPETNVATLVISVICIVILVLVNHCINHRFKHKLKIPIPIEIILIAISTLISYFVGFNTNYGVRILNSIPTGLPTATPPRFDLIPDLMVDSVVVTVLTFTIIMSQAKVLSSKYDCFPDISQELFANGVSNILGSFFSSLPCSFAFVRCMLLIQLGARSMLCSIVCAMTLMLVLLFMGPVFEPLPYSVLASIIIVALAEILLDLKMIKSTWKSVKTDSLLLIISFMAVFLLDLQIGIAVGLIVSMIFVVFKAIRVEIATLGHVKGTDMYLDVKKYKKATELESIKILHIGGSLFFATKDSLKKKVDKKVIRVIEEARLRGDMSTIADSRLNITTLVPNEVVSNGSLKDPVQVQPSVPSMVVILEFSSVNFIDTAALRQLVLIKENLHKVDAVLYICGLTVKVLNTLEKSETYPKVKGNIYPTVHDAVIGAQMKLMPVRELTASPQHAYDNPVFTQAQ